MSSRGALLAFGATSSVPVVTLENLESFQDRWIQRYEKSRRPPPAPQLTSPRSLRACDACHIDASRQLQKLSLRQHLNAVMGTDLSAALDSITQGDPARARVAMQSALYAFQRAAIGLGTSQEKLVAFHAFEAHEKARVQALSTAQQVRRQLSSESSCDRRNPRSSFTAQSEVAESRATGVGALSGSHRRSPPRAGPAFSGSSTGLIGTASRTRHATTPPQTRVAASPVVPFTPRNAEALNTSVFGNRTLTETTCNPSGAYVSSAKSSGDRGARASHEQGDARRQPLARSEAYTPSQLAGAPKHPTPTHKSLFPAYREEDSVVSVDSAHMDWVLGTPVAAHPSQPTTHVERPRQTGPVAAPASPRGAESVALGLQLVVRAREASSGADSGRSSSNRAAPVSPVTHLEQEQGIFYYCANARPLFSTVSSS